MTADRRGLRRGDQVKSRYAWFERILKLQALISPENPIDAEFVSKA